MATQYHTARFGLVPHLAKALTVPVPPLRRPGSAWIELPRPTAAAGSAARARIGYAHASTAGRSLDSQLDSLTAIGVTRIFSEKISTRAAVRPELDKAVTLTREIRASGAAVTVVVHEHKRLGRGIELAGQLRADGISLEFLTGELQGSHDPSGVVFIVLAVLSGMEREYIRERTLEGHESARARQGHRWRRRHRRGDARRRALPALPGAEPTRHRQPPCYRPWEEEGPAPVVGHRNAYAPRARREDRRGGHRRLMQVGAQLGSKPRGQQHLVDQRHLEHHKRRKTRRNRRSRGNNRFKMSEHPLITLGGAE